MFGRYNGIGNRSLALGTCQEHTKKAGSQSIDEVYSIITHEDEGVIFYSKHLAVLDFDFEPSKGIHPKISKIISIQVNLI